MESASVKKNRKPARVQARMGGLFPARNSIVNTYSLELPVKAKVAKKLKAFILPHGCSPFERDFALFPHYAAVSGAREVIRRNSTMRCRTYPSSVT